MKAICRFLIVVMAVVIATGCKKSNPDIEALVTLVNTVNATPEHVLKNGTTLNSCEYAAGDTVVVYNITVPDKRYDGLSNDSIKTIIKRGLDSKLVRIISRNDIGLRYNLKLPDKEEVVEISSLELKR